MSKRNHRKENRTLAQLPRSRFSNYLPDGSTVLFTIGIFLFAFGSSLMQYSRWNHAYNRQVIPVFHPWAIVAGVLLTGFAVTRMKKENDRR